METISDYSWLKQMLSARIIERFRVGELRAVALDLTPAEGGESSAFRFRILLFAAGEQKPIAAFNLESSILGSSCLTEQVGHLHQNLGHGDEGMPYERFKAWALERAASFASSVRSPTG